MFKHPRFFSTSIRQRPLGWALPGLLLLLHPLLPARAQETNPFATLGREEIIKRQEALESRTDLPEDQRATLSEMWGRSLSLLEEAEQLSAKTQQLQELAKQGPEQIILLENQQLELEKQAPDSVPANASLEELKSLAEDNEATLKTLSEELQKIGTELEEVQFNPEEYRDELETVISTRQELERKAEKIPAAPQNEMQWAVSTENHAQYRAALARMDWLETRFRTRDIRESLALKNKELLQARLEAERIVQGHINQRMDAIRLSRASASRSEAQAVKREAGDDVELQKEADKNEEYSADLIKSTRGLSTLRGQLIRRDQQVRELQESTQQVRRILSIPNLPATYAEQLRQDRNRIISWRVVEREARNRHKEDSTRRLKILEYRKEQEVLTDRIKALNASENAQPPPLLNMLKSREDLIRQIIQVLEDTKGIAGKLDFAETRLVAESQSLAALLDRKLLWIRSLKPVGVEWLQEQEAGHQRFWTEKSRYLGSPGELFNHLLSRWPFLLLGTLVLGLAFHLANKGRAYIRVQGEKTGRMLTDRFTYTTEVVFMTLLVSLPIPLTLLALSFLMLELPSGEVLQALGFGFRMAAGLLLILQCIREIHRAGGLAEKHFMWPETPRIMLLRAAGNARWIFPPLVTLIFAANWNGEEWIRSGVGRVAFLASMVLMSWSLHRLLRHPGGLLEAWMEHASLWNRRITRAFVFISVTTPIVLVLLTLRGYYYSARQVAGHSLLTLLVIFGCVLLFNLSLRWLVVARRQYAINQARERREAAKNNPRPENSQTLVPVEDRSIRDELSAIDTQTRKLLRLITLVLGLLGVVAVWRPLLPALNALEDINWDTSGGRVITLWDVTRGLLTFIVTFIAARNVPGMLEIMIPGSVPLSRSSRYALSALSRYVIVIVGIVMGFGFFGIGWRQVQWLAAAVTVGLGFGLQEIFANFVSGLIILFEQPIRVGDIVTIDNVSGSVTKIRMRATTITNWERKEFIVPNKEFVTGRLMNWTLSDSVNRILLTVGVAYGTDLEKALRLLESVAKDHPLIMEDPAPSVAFDQFGDNALTLTLRCYLPNMDDRLKTITELHIAVDKAYREAGIEISFPQRDLHLRSLPPELSAWLQKQEPAPPGNPS